MHFINYIVIYMKHRITTLLVVLPLFFWSCSKDYFSELRHPIEIQGAFDPIYGFPLAKMSANIGTIVGMFDTNQDITIYIGPDDVVSFRYDYTHHAVLSWTNGEGRLEAGGTKGEFDTVRSYSIIEGTQTFDLFEKLQYFDTNSFNVNEFLITVDADVQGFVNSSFNAVVAAGADLTFDSLASILLLPKETYVYEDNPGSIVNTSFSAEKADKVVRSFTVICHYLLDNLPSPSRYVRNMTVDYLLYVMNWQMKGVDILSKCSISDETAHDFRAVRLHLLSRSLRYGRVLLSFFFLLLFPPLCYLQRLKIFRHHYHKLQSAAGKVFHLTDFLHRKDKQ